ncbi:MAG: GH1 family beta-glucosidase [Pseudomonadota bacterium]
MAFPKDFQWGAATSAFQVEGSPRADGAGENIWERFCREPGRIFNGDTAEVACDHYRRFSEDIAWMRKIGLTAYRFSIAWARVMPNGTGRINQKGLDFYRRLVDELREAGIEPFATLYHWDLPAVLQDRGGWPAPDAPQWFAEYASAVFRALDGPVRYWMTLNEPWVVVDAGYLHGVHAPGRRSPREAALAAHHLLRAHADAVAVYRQEGRHQIGLVVNLEPQYPASETPADQAAARRAHAYLNRWFLDPVFLGRYPSAFPAMFGDAWPDFSPEDLASFRNPGDFLGINYYSCGRMRDAPGTLPPQAHPVKPRDRAYTAMDWEIYPQGLTDTLIWVKRRYGDIPIYITENGAAFEEPDQVTDTLMDTARMDYLRAHLCALRVALAQGVDIRGYFAWSLFDNFEWGLGFSKRFGLIHVDRRHQHRTPKASAGYLSRIIASHGMALDEDP